ncbi:hypothetical protein CRG98_041583 [Punica granatum]|uniref:Tf2-1-like SH3-like domain-containing protein n=1 Tax=Punica granatum TaxID=22663 RepID=A0A2I0I208_PUNGR|nr:hypothetical protein CRG98_041583 [Punica granatum]
MDEENVHEFPRGLTLDQAQFRGFQQRQDELSTRLDKLTQVVERMALARAALPRAHRVPKRNVQVEDEANREDELPDEEEQPVPRRQQRGEFNLLTLGCELRESQKTTIARFLGDLNKGIADMIKQHPFVSLEDVIKLVVKVRRQRKHGQLTTPRVFNSKPVIAGSTPQGSASRWNEPRKEVEGSLKSQPESAKVKEQEVDPQPPIQCRDIKCLEFHGFRHLTSEFPNWRDVTIQNSHAIKSDLVWIHLRKERFPSKRKSKLMPPAEGLFLVKEKVNNDNAYKIELPDDYNVSATFNVGDLSPYFEEEDMDLRANPSEPVGDDVPKYTIQDEARSSSGPITRSLAKKLAATLPRPFTLLKCLEIGDEKSSLK